MFIILQSGISDFLPCRTYNQTATGAFPFSGEPVSHKFEYFSDRFWPMTILTISILMLLVLWQPAEAQNGAGDHHPDRIMILFEAQSPVISEIAPGPELQKSFPDGIITLERAASMPETEALIRDYGLESMRKMVRSSVNRKVNSDELPARDRMFVAYIAESRDLDEVIRQLQQRNDIIYAEPDFKGKGSGKQNSNTNAFPNDRLFHLQWGLENSGQAIDEVDGVAGIDINILPAWEITTGSSDVTLAVLDSGQPDSVPDFGNRVVPGYNFVSNSTNTADDHGHGTSVASIALATGDNDGVMAGVDWNASIMPVKILDENNEGSYSWWIDGIYWAMDNGADVLNMSVGGSSESNLLRQAVEDALSESVHVIACMMNEDNDVTFYPAGYDGVVSVGAINNRGERASPFSWGGGSNYGDHIDLVAPGDMIVSLSSQDPESGTYWSGTSQAAPMVAGVVSMMLSLDPGLSPQEVKDLLTEQADGDGTWDRYYGWGRLDAHEVIRAVYNPTGTEVATDKPEDFLLEQNYPNPFNPSTEIGFRLPEAADVRLEVFDILGRRVALLVDEQMAAGRHQVTFDGTNLSSGTYIYRLTTGDMMRSRTMVLLK